MELEVEKWDTLIAQKNYEIILEEGQCADLVRLLLSVQENVKFFKANLTEYKKADVYLRRYENLRERVVNLTTNLVLKTIKEAL